MIRLENIVSCETANLAKLVDFTDYEVHRFYIEDVMPERLVTYSDEKTIPAPTQAILAQWLREKHSCNINVSVESYDDGLNFLVQVLFYNKDKKCWDNDSTPLFGDNGQFSTYESALEFGLKKALYKILSKKII